MKVFFWFKQIFDSLSKPVVTPNLKRPYLFKDHSKENVYIDKNGCFVDLTVEQIMEQERNRKE